MVESLIAGEAVLVNIDDRTQVISLKEWNITHDDILHIYDHGGHFVYAITTPLFVAKDSLIFLVHDITKVRPVDTNKTTEILRQALHQYPENKIYIIFTHIDLIDDDQVARNTDTVMDKLKQFLDDEISNLNKILIVKKSDIADDTAELLEHFMEKRSNLSVFCVSSESYAGMKKVKECLMNVAKEKRTDVPESWVEFYKQIIGTKKIYLTLSETLQLFPTPPQATKFERLLQFFQRLIQYFRGIPHNVSETFDGAANPKSEHLVPLQYFSDSNLFLHYESNPFLKDYVFHDIDVLVDLFKSVFHHNIAQVINYDNNENLQAQFQKAECDLAVQRYQKEGLLGKKLLSFLWEQYRLSLADETVLLQLMQSFNLCYSISKDQDILYFPWFVQSRQCPPHIDRDNLMKFDKGHMSVHLQCEFFNRIPLNVFEMVLVCLQRKGTQEYHYMGDRQAWHDGLEISFGSVQCVLTRSEQNSLIDICLYGKVDDIPKVWEVMEILLRDLQDILKPWKGVIRSIHFVCGHCIIFQISPPNYWLPDHVFPRPNLEVSNFIKCPKDPTIKDIPAALIMNCFKGECIFHFHFPCPGYSTYYLKFRVI